MKKITGFLFAFLMVTIGFSQGHETFDNVEIEGNGYVDGNFTGQDGSTWEYVQSRGDEEASITEGDQAIMLGRNKDSEVTSGTLQNGIGTLQFSYMQAFSTGANLEVYVNDDLVYTATTDGEQGGEAFTTDEIVVNADGDFTLRFYNPSGAGQVNIDDVIWTATGEDTTLNITSPSDGYQYPPEVLPTIQFNVSNFIISSDADSENGDGYVQYQVDDGDFNNHFSTQAIELEDLAAGDHEVVLRLVDNDEDPIDGLTASVTFTMHEYIEISTIGELRAGELNGYYTLTGEAVLTYQQDFRNQKYIQDDTGAILIDDDSNVITTTYNRYDGITGITGKLNINDGTTQLQPTQNTDVATSSDNSIVPIIISISDLMDDPDAYESQIIAFENVQFVLDEGEVDFQPGYNYTLGDEGENTTTMRTNFYDADYIGNPIPTGYQDAMVGIAARFHEDGQLFIRDTDDLEGAPLSTESFNKNEISFYPNPATTVLNIELEGKAQVEIYSILGQRVIQTQIQNQKSIAVDHLISGVYLVKIVQDGKAVTKKLIIQ